MKGNIKAKSISLLLSVFFLTTVGGCTPNNNTAKNKDVAPPSNNTVEKNNDMKENDNTKNNITKDTNDGDLYQRATKIADEVVKIDGIKSANVVILDERALIAVDIENTAEGKITDELKSKVESTAKKADKEIKTVAVSADPDIFNRLSNIVTGIKEGKPLSKFGAEIEEIFRRIMPK
ncbi:YhcN/YlaJ family sporulation lipoprotein [Clostridium cochlearium]|uniref:YhcN/YlaJ family sporulation lipoprotein n=1 Tax=Clostridium cochlearium TaxID=1494 RepID=UPI00145970EC|nr:YhcN/YlaJ family sporulation lipoprotein [Clostridium cochlearium]NME94816.1 YhcN/YlaJ family sporulation lipoprotein [Clostridium cochlearium]